MKIILTGGSGYLGSLLTSRLLSRGFEVVCIVRDLNNIGRLAKLTKKVPLIHAEKLEDGFRGFKPDIVIHTACVYARGTNTFADVIKGNFIFPIDVLRVSIDAGVKRWINTGTCLPPMLNTYALAKHQFSQWGKYCANNDYFEFINLELEHFYGKDAPHYHFLAWITDKLKKNEPVELTAGTQKRDLIYVEDVLDIYETMLIIQLTETCVEIPVGTGVAPTIREVVEYLKNITHSQSELHFGAVPMREGEPDSNCDISRMLYLGLSKPLDWKSGLQKIFK